MILRWFEYLATTATLNKSVLSFQYAKFSEFD
jgi:hypothetical protein